MKTIRDQLILLSFGLSLPCAAAAAAPGDWPQWGRDSSRNMVSPETSLPHTFSPGKFVGSSDTIDASTLVNTNWVAKLGSQSYGNPTVCQGRVFVGTNNDGERDPRYQGDRSVVFCFKEQDGSLLWQLNVPKLGTGKVSDWEYLGICSSPAVEGNRVYLVTNRCEVICLDIDGMANGNDGPFKDEGQYLAGPGKPPLEVKDTDADILWVLNMIDECGVFPHNITSSSVLIAGDRLWVSTSNGVDYGHVETPAPFAPCLIQVDKQTGKLLGEEASGLSQRIFHGNWTSPAFLKTDTLELCIFGGPDGRCYAFETEPVMDEKEGLALLKERWRFDCNPPEYRTKDGKPIRYTDRKGPSEMIATPVVYKGRVYASIGQDPEHGEGIGNLVCIDPSGSGDITATGKVWSYSKIHRSLSTVAIHDDLLFTADFSGYVYCLDARTGEEYWVHDTMGHIWGSPLVADGRLFVGNEDGYLTILPASKDLTSLEPVEINMQAPVYATPIAANKTLFIATHSHLFAFADGAPE